MSEVGHKIVVMTSSFELVAVDLTAEQREFVATALHQWAPQWALAASGKPFRCRRWGYRPPKSSAGLRCAWLTLSETISR